MHGLTYFAHGSGGEVLWWARLSVCLSVREDISGTMRNLYQVFCACCLWPWLGPPPAGWQSPKGKGQSWGFSSPLTMHCNAFAAKGINQSPITSCSTRDHSAIAMFTANGIGREGGDGSAQQGWSVIYDCLVAPCILYYLSNQSKNKLPHKQCG